MENNFDSHPLPPNPQQNRINYPVWNQFEIETHGDSEEVVKKHYAHLNVAATRRVIDGGKE